MGTGGKNVEIQDNHSHRGNNNDNNNDNKIDLLSPSDTLAVKLANERFSAVNYSLGGLDFHFELGPFSCAFLESVAQINDGLIKLKASGIMSQVG